MVIWPFFKDFFSSLVYILSHDIYRHIKKNQLSFAQTTWNIQRKLWIIQRKENICFGESQFLPLTFVLYKSAGLLSWGTALLLTPILMYIYACIIVYVIYDIHVRGCSSIMWSVKGEGGCSQNDHFQSHFTYKSLTS